MNLTAYELWLGCSYQSWALTHHCYVDCKAEVTHKHSYLVACVSNLLQHVPTSKAYRLSLSYIVLGTAKDHVESATSRSITAESWSLSACVRLLLFCSLLILPSLISPACLPCPTYIYVNETSLKCPLTVQALNNVWILIKYKVS